MSELRLGNPGTVAAEPFVQQAKLSDLDGVVTRLADHQGISVSVDGNTAVVGASGDENNRGSAYVFRVPLLEPADVDGNGVIDLPDFLAFAGAFGTTDFRFDFNEDGTVEFSDFLIFVGLYGQSA